MLSTAKLSRDQRNGAAVGHPLLQLRIAAVEADRAGHQLLAVGLLVHLQQHLGEAGAEQHEVARFDDDVVLAHHLHQLVVADDVAGAAEMRLQVDHHAAALHAGLRHVLHAEMPRALRFVARRHVALRVVVGGADDVAAGAIAVVEHVLGAAVAIGVEHLADMGKAVPLRRVLQRQQHRGRRRRCRWRSDRRSAAGSSCWAGRRAWWASAPADGGAGLRMAPPG